MPITLSHRVLCCILWETSTTGKPDKIETIIQFLRTQTTSTIVSSELHKVENFVKLFEVKMKSVNNSLQKFQSKFDNWMDINMEIKTTMAGRPLKHYDDLGEKAKQNRRSEILSTRSSEEVKDAFKDVLKRNQQPMDALKIADILPEASPKRLKRIVESIPTPSSQSDFCEEEAIALMLELGLSRNKYVKLRKALCDKGHQILPPYKALWEKKENIIPSPTEISNEGASVELSQLLENTASRLLVTFSANEAMELNKSDLTLICKWGVMDYPHCRNTNNQYQRKI